MRTIWFIELLSLSFCFKALDLMLALNKLELKNEKKEISKLQRVEVELYLFNSFVEFF